MPKKAAAKAAVKCDFCPRDLALRCRRCRRPCCGVHDYGDFCPTCDKELREALGPWYRVEIDKGERPAGGDRPALVKPRAARNGGSTCAT